MKVISSLITLSSTEMKERLFHLEKLNSKVLLLVEDMLIVSIFKFCYVSSVHMLFYSGNKMPQGKWRGWPMIIGFQLLLLHPRVRRVMLQRRKRLSCRINFIDLPFNRTSDFQAWFSLIWLHNNKRSKMIVTSQIKTFGKSENSII